MMFFTSCFWQDNQIGLAVAWDIFSQRILGEKYLQHQKDLHLVFIDFKKTFDGVWHAALWATMEKYNISTILIQVIKHPEDKATSAVLFNGNMSYTGSPNVWALVIVSLFAWNILMPFLFWFINIFGTFILLLDLYWKIVGAVRDKEEIVC